MGSEALCHQRHKLLEVTELADSLDDLGVLNALEILFELAREGLAKAGLELAKFLIEAPELRVVFAL